MRKRHLKASLDGENRHLTKSVDEKKDTQQQVWMRKKTLSSKCGWGKRHLAASVDQEKIYHLPEARQLLLLSPVLACFPLFSWYMVLDNIFVDQSTHCDLHFQVQRPTTVTGLLLTYAYLLAYLLHQPAILTSNFRKLNICFLQSLLQMFNSIVRRVIFQGFVVSEHKHKKESKTYWNQQQVKFICVCNGVSNISSKCVQDPCPCLQAC